MKNFYKTPETKDEMISNINEMLGITNLNGRDARALISDATHVGVNSRTVRKYLDFVEMWVESHAHQQPNWKQTLIDIYAEWGHTATINGGFVIVK